MDIAAFLTVLVGVLLALVIDSYVGASKLMGTATA